MVWDIRGNLRNAYQPPGSSIGIALHSTVHQIVGTIIQLIVIYLTFGIGLKVEGILPALGIFALMMLALYGFGIVISALGLILKEGWVVSDSLYSIMMILSPVAYPLIVLPTVAQQASALFPTAPALIGMRSFLIEGYQAEAFGNVFLHLLVLGVAWILFGIVVFRLTDVYVRKRGMLKKF